MILSMPHRWTRIGLAGCCLAAAVLAGCNQTTTAGSVKKLRYPKLRDIQMPKVERVTLANGMQLFLVEDHELPLINLSAAIHTGSLYEPADKTGLAGITGEVMRTGGTTDLTGDEIDERLERIAASVETGIGLTSGYASASSLKEDFDTALTTLADLLMHPAFRQNKLDLAKMQHRSGISRRNDDPGDVASREFGKLIYGPDSIYARQTEYATIEAITRDDLVAFHKRFYGPNNMMVAVSGDFNTADMVAKITKAFEGWNRVEPGLIPAPGVNYPYKATVNLVAKDDINQSNIYLGHIGGRLDDPDYYALVLMNRVLGGGFTSRLFRNVRSREGLAYSVFGNYSADFDHEGVFTVGCETQSAKTVYAIKAMRREVQRITEAEVTDEELAVAKESFLNSFVFNFASKGNIVRRLMTYAYYGYPEDFLQKTKANVEKVTKADVLRVARKHLRPDALQILVVGKAQDFDQPLSTLGEVRQIDITIPPPPAADRAEVSR